MGCQTVSHTRSATPRHTHRREAGGRRGNRHRRRSVASLTGLRVPHVASLVALRESGAGYIGRSPGVPGGLSRLETLTVRGQSPRAARRTAVRLGSTARIFVRPSLAPAPSRDPTGFRLGSRVVGGRKPRGAAALRWRSEVAGPVSRPAARRGLTPAGVFG